MCLADIRSYNESARKETEGYCHWKYEDYHMNTYWQTECDNDLNTNQILTKSTQLDYNMSRVLTSITLLSFVN